MMKLLSWNSRGMGHPSKSAALRDLIQSERPDIILLQETKQSQSDMQKIVDAQKNFLGISNDSRGASGGVAVMWSSHLWDCKSFSLNQNWLKINLVQKDESCDIIIYNVYIPNQFREKEQCWEELKEDINKEHNPNVILAGDLNLVLHANEKRGGNFLHDPCRNQLEGIMSDHELMDIIPKNRKFTWNNRRLGPGRKTAKQLREENIQKDIALGLQTPMDSFFTGSKETESSGKDYERRAPLRTNVP
eukprot:PITA_03329